MDRQGCDHGKRGDRRDPPAPAVAAGLLGAPRLPFALELPRGVTVTADFDLKGEYFGLAIRKRF